MTKEIIAVDIDDVLGNEIEAMRLFINEHYGRSDTAEDYAIDGEYWKYWETVWGVGTEKSKEMYDAYVDAGLKAAHQPLPGAIETLAKLKQDYELVIITSRGDRHVAHTHSWLDIHFPGVFKGVEFVPLWGDRDKISKAYIAQKLGASYLVDDHYDHCRLASEAGLKTLLFGEYGWNRSKAIVPGMTRVKDWAAVSRYFDARS